jgi:hypothetical protein
MINKFANVSVSQFNITGRFLKELPKFNERMLLKEQQEQDLLL